MYILVEMEGGKLLMSMEKLKCPYCHRSTTRKFSINLGSTSKTIHWTRCDNKDCRKLFGYKDNGKVETKK